MFKLAKLFFITCETPMHAGSGSDLGIVDLPIQREKHTGFPKIESSSLKGCLREAFEEYAGIVKEESARVKEKVKIHLAFGYDKVSEGDDKVKKPIEKGSDEDTFSGALGFTDARLLLFPVKSMKGVFAYITCQEVLKKFQKELKLCEIELVLGESPVPAGKCVVSDREYIAIEQDTVILEEYAFTVSDETKMDIPALVSKLEVWTGNTDVRKKLVILSEDDFKDFVNLSTEVITRTKIDNETGTVAGGALFTEEYLPAESVLYSLALANPVFMKNKNGLPLQDEKSVMKFFQEGISEKVIQIGGNATIGKGIASIRVIDGGDKS